MTEHKTTTNMFFSLDAPDGNGVRADVQVTVGEAMVEEIRAPRGKKMVQVYFVPRDTEEQYPISGWVPATGPIIDAIRDADQNNKPIKFRLESVRHKNIDRTWTVNKKKSNQVSNDPKAPKYVEGKDRFKRIVGVAPAGTEDWYYDPGIIQTNPKEDADFQNHGGSAFNMSLEELNPNKAKPASTPAYTGYEAPVFRDFNQDGSLNLGGNGVIAALGVLSFVREHLEKQEVTLPEEKVFMLATNLIAMVNNIQMNVYHTIGGNPPGPMVSAGSHTRIRGAMFTTITYSHPITQEDVESKETLGAWARKVAQATQETVEWAVKTIEPHLKH